MNTQVRDDFNLIFRGSRLEPILIAICQNCQKANDFDWQQGSGHRHTFKCRCGQKAFIDINLNQVQWG